MNVRGGRLFLAARGRLPLILSSTFLDFLSFLSSFPRIDTTRRSLNSTRLRLPSTAQATNEELVMWAPICLESVRDLPDKWRLAARQLNWGGTRVRGLNRGGRDSTTVLLEAQRIPQWSSLLTSYATWAPLESYMSDGGLGINWYVTPRMWGRLMWQPLGRQLW